MNYKKVIDISTFDDSVDYAKMAADGIVAVIIRAGYGMNNIDEDFIDHIKGANSFGMPAGIYWFSYAWDVDMAKLEALKCIEVIKKYKIDLPVFWDFEYDSFNYAKSKGHEVSRKMLNAMAEAFCEKIKMAGYKAGIYFNKDYRNNKFYKETLDKYYSWYAYYNSDLDDSTGIDLWQFTSKAEVNGVPAPKEDLNYLINESLLPNVEKHTNVDEHSLCIKELQRSLNKSYMTTLAIDGIYGPKTKAVVRAHYLSYKKPTIKNDHVKWLQSNLKKLGYDIIVDGSFGPKTKTVVEAFQSICMLTVDGLAGPATHTVIIELV